MPSRIVGFLLLSALLFPASPTGSDAQSHRNLGKAHYERGDYALAVREFLKVLEMEPGQARDHFNTGMALLQNGDYDHALSAFTTAKQIDPRLLAAEFGLGILYKREMRHPQALAALQRVAAADPGDPCTWLNIGVESFSLGQWAEAQQAFERVLAMGFPLAQNFYVSALFRQATIHQRQGRREEAQKLFAEFESLRDRVPNVSLTATALENGRHARIETPVTPPAPLEAPPTPTAFALLAQWRVDGCPAGREAPPRVALGDVDSDGLVDLFVANPCGPSRLYRNQGGGRFTDITSSAGLGDSRDGLGALFIDHNNSGFPSLLVLNREANRFYQNRRGRFTDATVASGLGRELAASAGAFDFDNDSQLDLFFAGARGLRVYRNGGDGNFREALGLPALPEVRAAAFADFDNDGFADLLVTPLGGSPTLLRNLGDGRFEALPAEAARPGGDVTHVEVGDFDQDGSLDSLVSGPQGWGLLHNTGGGRFEALPGLPSAALHAGGIALLLDANGDGRDEVLMRDVAGQGRSWTYRGAGRFEETRLRLPASPSGLAAWADLDGRGNVDLVDVSSDGRVRVFRRTSPARRAWLCLALAGDRTNRQGVGAVVEVKAGSFYRKELARGLPLLVSTGGRTKVDVVRITWSNGIIQNELDVPAGRRLAVRETDRQSSSCPFLYLWDGERFRFLTDVVGRSPLGERLPHGQPVSPNPDDYVRIPPDAMRPRDGRYVFQVTEELRETAYLDAVELIAVDHPRGAEVYADERYPGDAGASFEIHSVSVKQLPRRATNDRGDDLRPLLSEADGRYVDDFARAGVPGLTERHAIILDPGRLSGATSVRLFLTGWVYWVNSSGMLALSSRWDLALEPPALQVKDTEGRWVTVIEDLGIPSGINRTLVADLTGKFLSADRSVRIATNLAVYWDQAFFATDSEPASPVLHRLAPVKADLHHRGFSFPVHEPRSSRPDFFDYAHLLEPSPWNAAPGLYTRFGTVDTLLAASDDHLVVMATGDELTLAFDAAALPPLPEGSRRDFILHFTGWAKDHEPATLTAGSVEPLPFHGMAAYPPPAGEGFPATPEADAYRREFQTRRMPRLLPDLAPLVAR